ncbi:MAG: Gfo/Idh/MocA family oxidoreductase, partial [Spirochaetota bacterium]
MGPSYGIMPMEASRMSAPNDERVRIGLYGDNGHQLRTDASPAWLGHGVVVAFAGFAGDGPAAATHDAPERRASLNELLADPSIDLISLCSPRRADQALDAIRCLEAGKHVLAEKPCAMDEASLDRIIETTRRTGLVFHEMAPTVVEEPYATI